ncbi:MAG: DUF4277 domain-containing protein [Microscillaceae bacterium]|nr:DUF4277 domain-containing protein [Microscillaceae bacterium]
MLYKVTCKNHQLFSFAYGRVLPAADAQQLISNGTCVKALILNSLDFVERRLYWVSQFFEDKPVSHLLGEGVQSEYLNDDRLARCLDSLYAFGLSELFSLLSFKACQVLGLSQDQSLHFYIYIAVAFISLGSTIVNNLRKIWGIVFGCRGLGRCILRNTQLVFHTTDFSHPPVFFEFFCKFSSKTL